jgi:hypothetical protein
MGSKKVNILRDAVGLEQEELVFSWRVKRGAVVTRTKRLLGGNGNEFQKLTQQTILGAGFHGTISGQ